MAMTLAIALPILAFVALLLFQLQASERQVLKRDTEQDVQSMARNVDRQLQDMATTLRLLANSPELKRNDIASFHDHVQAALRTNSLFVLLVEANGQMRLNTRRPYGEPLGFMSNQPSLDAALKSNAIEVSGVFTGKTSGQSVFNMTLPLQNMQAGAALIMTQNTSELETLIATDGLTRGWSSAIIDGDGKVVASQGANPLSAGEPFYPEIQPHLLGYSGIYQNQAVLPRSLLAYARVSSWPWKVVIWGPMTPMQTSILVTWRWLIIGGVVLLLLALFAVSLVAGQVRRTIREIAEMAESIGKGAIVSPVDSNIIEAHQVAVALSNASFDRSQAEDRVHFIMHELVHRTKNLLALTQAMMRQLAKHADSVPAYRDAVSARLDGLARSIELLTSEQWSGVSLTRVIDLHLANFLQSPDQLKLIGEDFQLKPEAVQNLGLTLHELGTNSVKYGALSVPTGHITIEWQPFEQDGKAMVKIIWTESGGPPVNLPERTGFGTTVTKTHAALAFSGEVQTHFLKDGLIWVLVAPRQILERL